MKTDPENADYTMEQGATRNFEPWRDKDRTVAQAAAEREEEERGNAMKVRTLTPVLWMALYMSLCTESVELGVLCQSLIAYQKGALNLCLQEQWASGGFQRSLKRTE